MDVVDAPELITREGGLWVFVKPPGWVVYGTREDEAFDLLHWARREHGAPSSLAPIHRLDRETSGIVLYAAPRALRSELGQAFADRDVGKEYLALVHGRARRKGIVRRKLDGAEALTRYRTLEWLGGSSLVKARPETGRKHQIRRHLHAIGHPVVGDDRYRPRRFVAVPGFPGRLWLHAAAVELPDGRRFEAPLPADLAAHLELLRDRATPPEEPLQP